MSDTLEYMSKNAYAAYLGISEKAVRNAIADGKIKTGWDADKKKIIKHLADDEYGFTHKVARNKPGVNKQKAAPLLTVSAVPSKPSKQTKQKLKDTSDKSELIHESSDDPDQFGSFENVPVAELLKRVIVHEGLPYNESLRLKMLLDVCKDKQQLELQQKSLVKRVDVERILYAVGAQLKKALKAMPARIVANIRASKSDADGRFVMDEEIDTILNDYANLEAVTITSNR